MEREDEQEDEALGMIFLGLKAILAFLAPPLTFQKSLLRVMAGRPQRYPQKETKE